METEDQQLLLTTLSGLPPDRYWESCNTPDRRDHWQHCRVAFTRLHNTLVSYFTGSPSPLDTIPAELRESFFLWREYYLTLYGLLHEAWEPIQDAASLEGLPLPATPGKLLIELLHDESDALFGIAFPEAVTGNSYFEFSPQGEYRFYQEGLKVTRLLHSRDLPHSEKQRIDRYRKQARGKLKGWLRFKVRLLFCLSVAEKAAKKNSFIKRKLRDFNRSESNWQSDLYGAINPAKAAKGFAFRNGEKLLSSAGGCYKS